MSPQVLPWHSGWTVGICVDNTLTRSRDRQAGSLPLRVTTLPHAVFLLTPEAAAAAAAAAAVITTNNLDTCTLPWDLWSLKCPEVHRHTR